MNRADYTRIAREELNKWGLDKWHVRLSTNVDSGFLGLCSHKDQCIILNAHHCDIHPEPEVVNTIRHEIAHALTPGHAHNETWRAKAIQVGCTNTQPCSHLSFTPEVVDAIRSGATIEVSYETEIIHKPKYQITRLQDRCDVCGKVAQEVKNVLIEHPKPTHPDARIITLECGHVIVKSIPKATPFHTVVSRDGKKPYPFQIDGSRFIEAALAMNKGAAVFDEMGLGKTIQVLMYLLFHPEKAPVLFIVKSGLKYQWFKEIVRWMGDTWIPQVITTSNDYLLPPYNPMKKVGVKAYIIGYDMLIQKVRPARTPGKKPITSGFDIERFQKLGIKTIVLDECQQVKNPDSNRTQQVRRIAANTNVIGLSGTPWKNRGSEFFTILNMMAPMKFPSYQKFLDQWVDFYFDGPRTKMGGIRRPKAFREYIKDIAIRRERSEVMKELPSISRNLQFTELDSISQTSYDESVSDFVAWYNNKIIGGEEDSMNQFEEGGNILARLAKMRHITGLAKIPATEDFVEEFISETDRKLVIFVHHKDVGQILFDNLTKKYGDEMPILKITADMDSEARFNTQEKFNSVKRAILVGSTLASGEGLNLQTCADCILHERQWNPANEEQAEGRFIRIGQESDAVNATYMTAAGTVDEILSEIVERKRNFFHAAMNKGEMPVWKQTDILKEVAEAIVKQAGKITKMASLK